MKVGAQAKFWEKIKPRFLEEIYSDQNAALLGTF